ncbi:MAG: AMP-binding protein [Rubrivivax sp.]|nr:AMP-binding protein [Rubrivivax sp.]
MPTTAHLAHWPAHVPRELLVPPLTLPQALAGSAARRPAHAAIVFERCTLTYGDLAARVDALAGWLQQRCGVHAGDRVLLLSQNRPAWVVAAYAVLRAGAVLVPVNPMCKRGEIAFHADDSGARVALVSEELMDELTQDSPCAVLPLADTLAAARAAALAPGPMPADPDALAVLPYTSGTTGQPKGCRHTHATLRASLAASAVWKRLDEHSVVLAVAPLFHMLGLQNGMNLPLMLGATAVMMTRWHAATAAELIERHRVTAWSAPPAMVIDLYAQPGTAARDFSSLKLLSGGGAAMPEAVAAMLRERHGLVYEEAYGLTETASFLHANPPQRCRRQCLGMPTQGVQSMVVDPETLAELPAGEVGELLTHAPQLMLGYWQRPDADAEAFVTIGGRRWFRTGDLAHVDDEGYYFLRDRLKRMVNVSGYKVWPAEVESLMYAHPAVHEACVIAVPDPEPGRDGRERVQAVVVLKPQARGTVDEAALIAWCRERMAVYKAPRAVAFVDALPKSGTGKIQWRELQETYARAAVASG